MEHNDFQELLDKARELDRQAAERAKQERKEKHLGGGKKKRKTPLDFLDELTIGM